MKNKLILLLATALCGGLSASDVVLTWNANPANQNVTGYKVYQASAAAGPWTSVSTVATNKATLLNIQPAVYFFRVTANNSWGESIPSNVVSTPIPAGAPGNVVVTIIVTVVP